MKTMILTSDFFVGEKDRKKTLREARGKWSPALLFSLTASVLTGLFGLGINGLAMFGFLKNNPHLETLGIWLTVLAFPLAALTAHCLDKMDEAKKAACITRKGTVNGRVIYLNERGNR